MIVRFTVKKLRKYCLFPYFFTFIFSCFGLLPMSAAKAQVPGCAGASGLTGEFYAGYFNDNQQFFTNNTPALTRTDLQLNFNSGNSWGAILPPASGSVANPDQFSARFRGSLYIAQAGTYTLYLGSDDASYLWLDNTAIASPAVTADALIQNGGPHGYQIKYASVYLSAGLHNLLIHYGERQSGNQLTFEYQSSGLGIPRQIVPSSALCTGFEKAIRYVPNNLSATVGIPTSSTAPLLVTGTSPLTNIVLANAALLPAGITIHPTTGVVNVNGTVPLGRYDLHVTLTNAAGSVTFDHVLTVSVLAPPPPGCSGTDAGGRPATSGLYAEYFAGNFQDDQSFFLSTSPRLIRTDANLNFNANDSWGAILPPAGGTMTNPTLYSARFRGSLFIATSGLYTFHLGSDDGSYLWLDNAALGAPAQPIEALIQNGGNHPYQIRSASVYLTAGRHNILVHYGQRTSDTRLTLEYQSAQVGIPRQIVPGNLFCTGQEKGILYRPAQLKATVGTSASTPAPVLAAGSSALTSIAIANAASLPAGITIHPTTGVVTVNGTVPLGSYVLNVMLTNAAGSLTFNDVLTVTVLTLPPADCAGGDPGGFPASSGLYAEFYPGYFNDNQAFFLNRIPRVARTVGRMDLNTSTWGAIIPPAVGTASDPDLFSARLRGSIFIAAAGTYTFYLGSDDASYLWLDQAALASPPATNQALIGNPGTHGYVVKSASVFLTAGMHPLLIHYGDRYGGNRLTLEYQSAQLGISRRIVPNQVLCTASSTSITYSPKYLNIPAGTAASSNAPAIVTGGTPLSGISIANASSLPAGISINKQTGVITAAATVPPGSYNLNVTLTLPNGSLLFNNIFTVIVLGPAPPGCYARNSGEAPRSGVYAEYYPGYFNDDQSFFVSQTPAMVRTDYQLNFNNGSWGAISPPAGGSSTNPDLFSVRYQGSLYVATAGNYTFHLGSDDASYLWLDGPATESPARTSQALISNAGTHGYVVKSGSVLLSSGLHDVLIHYGERMSANRLTLEYESTGLRIPRQLVPNTALCSGVSFVPLPVELLFFQATARTAHVALDWVTLSETNAAYFTVERSTDAQHFEGILRVDSRNGDSNSRQNYFVLDTSPKPGTNYYRLRTVDKDGTYTTSKIVAAEFIPGRAILVLRPNPVSQVDLSLLLEGELGTDEREVRVYTTQGMQVYQATFSGQQTEIPTRRLPVGLYIVLVKAGRQVFKQKVVVE